MSILPRTTMSIYAWITSWRGKKSTCYLQRSSLHYSKFLNLFGQLTQRGSLILCQAENWLTFICFSYFLLLSPGTKDFHQYRSTWKCKIWDFLNYPGFILFEGCLPISHGIAFWIWRWAVSSPWVGMGLDFLFLTFEPSDV